MSKESVDKKSRARRLKSQGETIFNIATIVGESVATVYQWVFPDWANPEKQRRRAQRALAHIVGAARNKAYLACEATVDEVLARFDGHCAICGLPEWAQGVKLALDHCHTSGKFRGWLCRKCNHGLGNFRDSPEILRKAADFLEQHGGRRL